MKLNSKVSFQKQCHTQDNSRTLLRRGFIRTVWLMNSFRLRSTRPSSEELRFSFSVFFLFPLTVNLDELVPVKLSSLFVCFLLFSFVFLFFSTV